MMNLEPTLERSTEICRLDPALFKSPESLLGSGDPEWQVDQLANLRLSFLHMVLNRCGLLWTASYTCKERF